ncbi:MAG TPA: DUF6011 domain-containing protein [Mycobacterium sp.]|nr:DUF6011 domain-containing protein [Mycobacterium sp.]
MTTKTAAPATTHCRRCHRRLSDATAVARGYGRTCWAKVQEAARAAAEGEPTSRMEAAVEAIEDGAVVHQTLDLWLVVSSKGDEVYTADLGTGGCTCKAGEHGRRCWHVLAAELLAGKAAPLPAPVALATPADPFANVPGAYAA